MAFIIIITRYMIKIIEFYWIFNDFQCIYQFTNLGGMRRAGGNCSTGGWELVLYHVNHDLLLS